MTKPISIPNTFATATTTIPLSQLDTNFTTVSSSINDANTYSNYAPDTGIANGYAVTFTSLTTSYTAGLRIQFKAANANTGASTLNVNGQGAKNILFPNGTSITTGTHSLLRRTNPKLPRCPSTYSRPASAKQSTTLSIITLLSQPD